MNDKEIRKIKELIEEAESWNNSNFTEEKYLTWKVRAENCIVESFGMDSAMHNSIKKASYSPEPLMVGRGMWIRINNDKKIILSVLNAVIDSRENNTTTTKKENDYCERNDVFIVHGHNEGLKNQLEILLREFGLEPIVLHRKPDGGMTIIEKFEKYSDVGYAFILLTPDDIGYSSSEERKTDAERNKENRARQNVIFEFGYFVGKLGRGRVCCLYKEGVALPTDVSGMIYKEVKEKVEEFALAIQKDLKAAGYDFNV